ncbi:MAG: 16S rRNA (guanine(966)-N(2))-methyltransferase RsmD [Candidatus Izimaplasma sp.]|nr:16S rRNA (guanine(966)-N(2))-methyltransferase RsmD [Candidatus Izimaplasma bacterium]
MLRVIAGKYKSRKLKEVKSQLTRPTTDKNKETMFNSVGQFFSGGHCLDLYAGSGALGIEALSRGMDSCDFVDKNYQAIKIIKTNLNELDILKQTNIYRKDAIQFLKKVEKKYDLIIADPPYKLKPYDELLNLVTSRQILNINGIIVLESDENTDINNINGFKLLKTKLLGTTKLTILRKESL